MDSVILIKVAVTVGIGMIAGFVVYRQLNKDDETKKYAKIGAFCTAVLTTAGYALVKLYLGSN